MDRIWRVWTSSPQRIIGLWPEWFYGPQPDWPPQAVVTGFIEYDGAPTAGALDELDCASTGDDRCQRPIVFTAGSGSSAVPDFFAAASETCEILNWPGVLLTKPAEPICKSRMVRHIGHTPLGTLLPRAAAIVHHGGIGTAARALKAGIPQVVMPMVYDQHDNARRLVHLGVARAIERRDFTAQRVAGHLRELLQSQKVLEQCRHYATKFESNNALEKTCEYIEALR